MRLTTHSLIIGLWNNAEEFGTRYAEMKKRHDQTSESYKEYTESAIMIHTYNDWRLLPSERPIFSIPTKKEEFLEVPGLDFPIDLSEALTGYPLFNPREGDLTFYAEIDYTYKQTWNSRFAALVKFLHGQKRYKIVLEDDPEYYYEGVLYVNEQQSDPTINKIVIGYKLEPYKTRLVSSIEPWLWDPFNFSTGIIYSKLTTNSGTQPLFVNHIFNTLNSSTEEYDWKPLFTVPNATPDGIPRQIFGKKPVTPKITVTNCSSKFQPAGSSVSVNGVYVRFVNSDISTVALAVTTIDGETANATNDIFIPDDGKEHDEFIGLIFTDQRYRGIKGFYVKGAGTITIDFRGGEL